MICPPCRGEFYSVRAPKDGGKPRHDECINKVRIDLSKGAQLVPRDEPIRSCACQHKESWNFSVGGKRKTEDNDGDSTKS